MAERFETVVVVTRRTELDELVARFATASQARFYLQQSGHDFAPIEAAHDRYYGVVGRLRSALPRTLKCQIIDRVELPRLTFSEDDLVVVIGQDGLVSNTAKYLRGQPVLGINPNPELYDGVLLPYTGATFEAGLGACLAGKARIADVTMAMTQLSDGQSLLAFNDFFIGAASHVSARYEIAHGERVETQSSSGVIVSTGAGSTGWLRSVYEGAAGIVRALGGKVTPPPNGGRLEWDDDSLIYSVREPFPSHVTGTSMVYGKITPGKPLTLNSHMASNGRIFSDGIEADCLDFNHGTSATISLAPDKARLVL